MGPNLSDHVWGMPIQRSTSFLYPAAGLNPCADPSTVALREAGMTWVSAPSVPTVSSSLAQAYQ